MPAMIARGPYDVTVVIPTYNRLWCLPAAVESCRATRCRLQVIVVDDGSTDATWEWLSQQPDVLALRQVNRGKDWAIAAAMPHVSGEYLRFLDSDDALVAGAVDRQLDAARAEDADLVVSGFDLVDEGGGIIEHRPYERTDDFIAQQIGEGDGSHYSAFLFRTEFVRDIPHRQEFGALDDRMYILEVALAGPRIAVVPAPALRHTHHARGRLQVTGGLEWTVKHFHHVAVYRRVLVELAARGELTPRRARAASPVMWRAAHLIAHTHPEDACAVVEWIRRMDPSFDPPEQGMLGRFYRTLGFRRTQALLRFRRRILAPVRNRTAALGAVN